MDNYIENTLHNIHVLSIIFLVITTMSLICSIYNFFLTNINRNIFTESTSDIKLFFICWVICLIGVIFTY
jgi:hypothetical protein